MSAESGAIVRRKLWPRGILTVSAMFAIAAAVVGLYGNIGCWPANALSKALGWDMALTKLVCMGFLFVFMLAILIVGSAMVGILAWAFPPTSTPDKGGIGQGPGGNMSGSDQPPTEPAASVQPAHPVEPSRGADSPMSLADAAPRAAGTVSGSGVDLSDSVVLPAIRQVSASGGCDRVFPEPRMAEAAYERFYRLHGAVKRSLKEIVRENIRGISAAKHHHGVLDRLLEAQRKKVTGFKTVAELCPSSELSGVPWVDVADQFAFAVEQLPLAVNALEKDELNAEDALAMATGYLYRVHLTLKSHVGNARRWRDKGKNK